jgi:3-hydroxyacyl-[acyl-carrier-protein] dehydratase
MPKAIHCNLERIQEILPHRSPFLFVDTVTACEPGVHLEANLTLDPGADFFSGHFPNRPIMPGVLVAEALAQASGLLIGLTYGARMNFQLYLAQVDIKFIQTALPGETLALATTLKKSYGRLFRCAVAATVGSRMIAEGSLVLAGNDS